MHGDERQVLRIYTAACPTIRITTLIKTKPSSSSSLDDARIEFLRLVIYAAIVETCVKQTRLQKS